MADELAAADELPVDDLPRSPGGRIDRAAAREAFEPARELRRGASPTTGGPGTTWRSRTTRRGTGGAPASRCGRRAGCTRAQIEADQRCSVTVRVGPVGHASRDELAGDVVGTEAGGRQEPRARLVAVEHPGVHLVGAVLAERVDGGREQPRAVARALACGLDLEREDRAAGRVERPALGGRDRRDRHHADDRRAVAGDEHAVAGAGRGGDGRRPLRLDGRGVEQVERTLAQDLDVRDAPRLDLDPGDRVLVAADGRADRDVGVLAEQGHQTTVADTGWCRSSVSRRVGPGRATRRGDGLGRVLDGHLVDPRQRDRGDDEGEVDDRLPQQRVVAVVVAGSCGPR